MVKAKDTDVLVIAFSFLPAHQEIGLLQLWIAFAKSRTEVDPWTYQRLLIVSIMISYFTA